MRHMEQKGEDYLTTLDILLDFTANNVIGEVYLAGDFNARTKNLNHVPVLEDFDGYKEKPDSGPSDFRRKSRDSVLNSRGKLLLDFLASTNLLMEIRLEIFSVSIRVSTTMAKP